MRKLVRFGTVALWIMASIWITIALDDSSFLSDDPFLRRMEVNLLMVGGAAFIYGLVFRRSPLT